MSSKRLNSNCRPDSARTQTTKLTLPSDTNLSLTTNSGFRGSERNPFADTQFAQSQKPLKPRSQIKKSFIKNDQQVKQNQKQKQKQKQEYEKMKQKPIKKNISSCKDEGKNIKQSKPNTVIKSQSNNANKFSKQKNEQTKPITNISSKGPQIKFDKWKINKPSEQSKQKTVKKSQQQREKEEQQKKREQEQRKKKQLQQLKRQQLNQMTKFINEMQLKNMNYLSSNYEISIQNATNKINSGQMTQLLEWNSNLDNEFSDFKFNKILKTIQDNEKQLEKEDKIQQQSMSSPSILNMTFTDLQQRNNLFITQINREKKLKSQSISTLSEIEKTQQKIEQLRLAKDQQEELEQNQQDQQQEQESQIFSSAPVRNPITNIIQRNIMSLSTPYYVCDCLSQVHKKRLAQLLEQIQTGVSNTPNPFSLSQQLQMHIRVIDEGIRVYRRQKIQPAQINSADLPREPELRKQAELKLIKQKLDAVNQKLLNLNQGSISKQQIKQLILKLKQQCLTPSSKIVQIKKQTLKDISNRNNALSEFIQNAQTNSKSIEEDMKDIKQSFKKLQQQILQIRSMSAEQQHQLQMNQLSQFRIRVQQMQSLLLRLPQQVQQMQQYARNIQTRIDSIQQQFGQITIERIQVPRYKPNQTVEDIAYALELKERTEWEQKQIKDNAI